MAPTVRGTISALLAPDLRKVYVDTGKERPLEYPNVFNVQDMEWNPVTDQQVSDHGFAALRELFAESVRTRSAVDHDQRSVRSAQLDARGIAPVADRRGPGRCDRTSRSPKSDLHRG